MTATQHKTPPVEEFDSACAKADTAMAHMDLTQRVVWLQRHGVNDNEIFTALCDPVDSQLDEFLRTYVYAATMDAVIHRSSNAPAKKYGRSKGAQKSRHSRTWAGHEPLPWMS